MKDITMKQKITLLVIALIILAGIIITFTIGFNFELKYQETKKIELYINKAFEISDIKEITNEVMEEQKVLIQKVEVYEDEVKIAAKEITEEQKQNIVEKINEKYETEIEADDIEIVTVPNLKGRDLLKSYIIPFAVATIIIVVYMGIRYKKLEWITVILKSIAIIVVAQATLFGVMAIARIPVGDMTLSLIIIVYVLTLLGLTNKFEKELKGTEF